MEANPNPVRNEDAWETLKALIDQANQKIPDIEVQIEMARQLQAYFKPENKNLDHLTPGAKPEGEKSIEYFGLLTALMSCQKCKQIPLEMKCCTKCKTVTCKVAQC